MNETVFREILGESLRREFTEFDNAPEHKFSLRHRLAMKKVFAEYEKNIRGFAKLEYTATPHYALKQRIIFALVIIILMTLLTGWFIPIRGLSEVQIGWLRSRYDFSTMKMREGERLAPDNDSPYSALGLFRETDEYSSFLDDLVGLDIYSEEEVDELQTRAMPMDMRPDSFKNETVLFQVPFSCGDENPLEDVRDYVSSIEEKMNFYLDRAKDPNRAVGGDLEFAELIRKDCWELNHGFLELLEKLFAEETDDEQEDNSLLNSDKDDRRYLLKINKL